MKANELKRAGFTIMELLVVLAVISAMVALIVPAISASIRNSKIQRAKADTATIASAIKLLQYNTNKSYGGCPVGRYMCRPDFTIRDTHEKGGLAITPLPFYNHTDITYRCTLDWTDVNYDKVSSSQYAYCDWTAPDIAKWQGPYMTSLPIDPWGNYYWIDYNYFGYSGGISDGIPYTGCENFTNQCGNNCANMHDGIAVISTGPDKLWYTCDDIQFYLYQLPNP